MSKITTTHKTGKKCVKAKLVPPPELESCFGKSYTLYRSENYDEFLQELGVKRIVRMKAIDSKPTLMLYLFKNKYVLSTSYPEGRHVKTSFTPGEKIQRRNSPQFPTTAVFQVVGNKIIEEQILDSMKVLTEREFKKKELIITMEVNDVKCYRWYKLLDSKSSINTETSRRTALWEATKESIHSIKVMSEPATKFQSEDIEDDLCY